MEKPFSDIRVIDLTTTIAGPACTRLLSDLGAEVIKIEAPDGDMMRSRPPLRAGASTTFGQLNAGKKSVTLDLKLPAAVRAMQALVAQADVLVENFRPGVMSRLGLDYASLAALNPRLVYCSISGYGQTGPSSQLPAYAPVVHAASGYDMAHLLYQAGRTRPDYCGVFFADVGAGAYAFGAIASALHQRHRTGRGQMVDVSMLETMLGFTLTELQTSQFVVPPPGRPMFGPVECADGYLMVAVASEKTFQNLTEAAGHTEWAQDPRFAAYADRRANWDQFMDLVEEWSRTKTMQQCRERFDACGVPCSSYRTVAEALADPQLVHRRSLAEIRDDGGTFMALNPPFRFSDADVTAGGTSPRLGEHTEQVLRAAGLGEDDLAALRG